MLTQVREERPCKAIRWHSEVMFSTQETQCLYKWISFALSLVFYKLSSSEYSKVHFPTGFMGPAFIR